MKHLDLISHISFRARRKNSITKIITLPVASEEIQTLLRYRYNISEEKYYNIIEKFIKHKEFKCNIYTVFGDKYEGHLFSSVPDTLEICSSKKMRYKNNYFNSIHTMDRKFRLIEI